MKDNNSNNVDGLIDGLVLLAAIVILLSSIKSCYALQNDIKQNKKEELQIWNDTVNQPHVKSSRDTIKFNSKF